MGCNYNCTINEPVKSLQRSYFASKVADGNDQDKNTIVIALEHIGMEGAKAIRDAGYAGYVKCIQNDSTIMGAQQTTCEEMEDHRYSVVNHDLIRDFQNKASIWIYNKTPKGWNVDSISFYEIVDRFIYNLSSNPRKYIGPDTFVSITFIAMPNAFQLTRMKTDKELKSCLKDNMDNMKHVATYMFTRIQRQLDQLWSQCSNVKLLPLPEMTEITNYCDYIETRRNVRLVIYGPSENKNKANAYKMGTFYLRLAHPPDCEHNTIRLRDLDQMSTLNNNGDDETATPRLYFKNCVFGDIPADCSIDKRFTFPCVPAKHQKYAAVIYYITYRLMSDDTSLQRTDGFQISYPICDIPFYSHQAKTVLYKYMQARKTPLAVAVIWIETFLFGNFCLYATRNHGCRATAIVGFKSKGIGFINQLIRDFIQDVTDEISTQIHKIFGNVEIVIQSLIMQCKTDQEMKWGDDLSQYPRNAPEMSETSIVYRGHNFINVRESGNTVVVFPTNKNGIRLVTHNICINRHRNAIIFWDEFDEFISSFNKNKTFTERSIHCQDDQTIINHKKRTYDNFHADIDDEDSDDDNDDASVNAEDLEQINSLSETCKRTYFITATMSPIIWSSHPSSTFSIVEMPPDTSYIGYDVGDDHCRNKIKHEPIAGVVRRKVDYRGDYGSDDFLYYECVNLDKINAIWERNLEHDNGALLVSQYSTDRIVKQETAARTAMNHCIAKKPLLVVVNNGKFTKIFFSHHFREIPRRKNLGNLFQKYINELGLQISKGKPFETFYLDEGVYEIPRQFQIKDKFGIEYGRRYPAVPMQIAKFLFSLLSEKCRLLMIETMAMAAREKSYVDFSGSWFLQILCLNYDCSEWTNLTQLTQTAGRICSVSPETCGDKRRYFLCPQKTYDSFLAYMKKQKKYVELWKKNPGTTIEDVMNSPVAGDSEWDFIFKRMLTKHYGSELKKGHRIEIIEKLENNGYRRVPVIHLGRDAVIECLKNLGEPKQAPKIADYLKNQDLFVDPETYLTWGGKVAERDESGYIKRKYYPTTQCNVDIIRKAIGRDLPRDERFKGISVGRFTYIGLQDWDDAIWPKEPERSSGKVYYKKLPSEEYQREFERNLREAASRVTDNMTLQEKFFAWGKIKWSSQDARSDNTWKVCCYIFSRNGNVNFEEESTLDISDPKEFKTTFKIQLKHFASNTTRYIGSQNGNSWRSTVAQGRHLEKINTNTWRLAWR
jgi:hypothetical protein